MEQKQEDSASTSKSEVNKSLVESLSTAKGARHTDDGFIFTNGQQNLHEAKKDQHGTSDSTLAEPVSNAILDPITRVTDALLVTADGTSVHKDEEELSLVAECFACVTGVEKSCLRPDTPFLSLGLDSLTAVELANEIQRRMKQPVEPFELFEFADLRSLALYLRNKKLDHGKDARGRQTKSSPERSLGIVQVQRPSVFVTGVACALPGSCQTPDKLWEILDAGIDCVGPIPPNRNFCASQNFAVIGEPRTANASFCVTEGGFLDDVDLFDNSFFGIPDAEAMTMDPQQRLLLMKAVEALHAAGMATIDSRSAPIATFVGCCSTDWQRMNLGEQIQSFSATSHSASMLSNRLSYTLGLTGASITVDTACSSSLTALHCAMQELQHRHVPCHTAVVATVNLLLTTDVTLAFARAGFLSPTYRCKTFDDAADGFVRSEGVVVFVLQTDVSETPTPNFKNQQEDNEGGQGECGTRIPASGYLCRILASTVVHGGKTGSVTAPSGSSQELLYKQTFACAQVPPRAVDLVETHGTGTRLGDPIEISALCNSFAPDMETRKHRLVLGALKTNLGHLEGASGLAGLLKSVLCLNRQRVPPNLHLRKLNRFIDFRSLPVLLPTKTVPLPASSSETKDAVALVTSLGFGGTYAQVAVQVPSTTGNEMLLRNQETVQWNKKCFDVGKLVSQSNSFQSAVSHNDTKGPCFWEVGWEFLLEFDSITLTLPTLPEQAPPAKWLVLTSPKAQQSFRKFSVNIFLPGIRMTFACLEELKAPEHLEAILKAETWTAIVSTYTTETGSCMTDSSDLIGRTLQILQTYGQMASQSAVLPRLLFLTQGCFQVGAAASLLRASPYNAGIIGFVRACRLEIESLSGRKAPIYLIDFAANGTLTETLSAVSKLLGMIDIRNVDETEFAICGKRVFAPRLLPLHLGLEEILPAYDHYMDLTKKADESPAGTAKFPRLVEPANKACRVRLLALCLDEIFPIEAISPASKAFELGESRPCTLPYGYRNRRQKPSCTKWNERSYSHRRIRYELPLCWLNRNKANVYFNQKRLGQSTCIFIEVILKLAVRFILPACFTKKMNAAPPSTARENRPLYSALSDLKGLAFLCCAPGPDNASSLCGCSGILLEHGADSQHLTVGNVVCGIMPRPHCEIADIPGILLHPSPPSFSCELAASLPPQLALLLWALNQAPPLVTPPAKRVSRVLIVGAGCGVGLVAATHFQTLGLKTFAVVCTEEQVEALVHYQFPHAAIWCYDRPDLRSALRRELGYSSIDMVVWALKQEIDSSNNHLLNLLKHGGSFVDLVACHPESRLGWRLDVKYVHCTLDLAARPYHAKEFSKNLALSCEILRQKTASQRQQIMHVFFDHAHRLGQHCSLASVQMTEAATPQNVTSPADLSKQNVSFRPGVNAVEFVSGYSHAGSVVCSLPSPIFFNKASSSNGNCESNASTASSSAALGTEASSNVRTGTVLIFDCGSGNTWQHLRQWLSDEGASHIVVVHACAEEGADRLGVKTLHPSRVNGGQGCSQTLIKEVKCRPHHPEEVVELFKLLKEGLHFPLVRGIFYILGEKLDSLLANQTTSSVHDMMKTASGAWSIHHALGQLGMEADLDFFIFFSSISALFGSISQSISAAVHASLDALAYYRRHLGLAATSIQWAPWADGSSATSPQIVRHWLEKGGVSSVRNPLAAVSAILKNHTAIGAVVACFHADPTIMHEMGETDQECTFLSSGPAANTRDSTSGNVKVRTNPVKSRVFQNVSPSTDTCGENHKDELLVILTQLVRREVIEIASCYVFFEGNNLSTDESLVDLGLDSLSAVELRHTLQQRFCVNIEPTFLQANATIDSISALLVTHVATSLTGALPVLPLSCPGLASAVDDCALVSLALRLPGRCDSLDAFWASLQSDSGYCRPGASEACDQCFMHRAGSGELPAESQSIGTNLDARKGFCWLSNRDAFDSHFFGISFTEALATDPCHRLLLEATYEALCKLNTEQQSGTSGTPIAVFATSSSTQMRASLPSYTKPASSQNTQDNNGCLAASFLSYHLNLTGLAVPIDGSDSASLIALDLGREHLRGTDSVCQAVVVAAGSLLPICSHGWPSACTSPTIRRFRGRDDHAFPDRETYAVPRGEGIVSVVLQRLSVARENGNSPMAILKGISLIRMGRGERPIPSQWRTADVKLRRKTIVEALKMSRVEPRTVAVLETDGLTGSQAEDAYTVEAMADIFGPRHLAESCSPLVIGNASLHIGQAREASGLATLAKLVLMLERGYAPPIPRLRRLHPDVKRGILPSGFVMFPCKKMDLLAFRQHPDHVYGPNEKRDQKEGRPLIGCVSSLGSDKTSGCFIVESSPRLHGRTSDTRVSLERAVPLAGTKDACSHNYLHVRSTDGSESEIRGDDRAVWLFCDDLWGLQSVGRGLYCSDPAFAALLEQAERVLGNRIPQPLSCLLYPSTTAEFQKAEDALAFPRIAAFVLFSLQWALATCLRHQEGEPTAVMGLGVGEIAAAAVAGILSLEDAVELLELLSSETRTCDYRNKPMPGGNVNSGGLFDRGNSGTGGCGVAQDCKSPWVLCGLNKTPTSESAALEFSVLESRRGSSSRISSETPTSNTTPHNRDVFQERFSRKPRRATCPSPIIRHAWEKVAHGNPENDEEAELECPSSQSRRANCPSPAIQHACEETAHGNHANDGEADLLMDVFRFRPEPSEPLGQVTARIALRNATCLFISTVSGRLATDTLIRAAEYWDPLVPKTQRVHRAVETAVQVAKTAKLVCIGCSAQDGVHLSVGLPSVHPISPSPLRIFCFTGSSPSPQLLAPCESASGSSPRVAVVEHHGADSNLGGGAPWWKHLLFRLPQLEGFPSGCSASTRLLADRLVADVPTPDNHMINNPQTAAVQGAGETLGTLREGSSGEGEDGEKGYRSESVNTQHPVYKVYRRCSEPELHESELSLLCSDTVCQPSLEKTVELFIGTGLEQQGKLSTVSSSWLVFSDIVAPSPISLYSTLAFQNEDGEQRFCTLNVASQVATVYAEKVKTQVCSIIIECKRGFKPPREIARCHFVKNQTAVGKHEPAVSSLSRIRWLPATKLPEGWLRTRRPHVWPCKIKVTKAACPLPTRRVDLQEIYWGKRHILCRFRMPRNPPRDGVEKSTQLIAILARLVTVSVGVAATCVLHETETSGRYSHSHPGPQVEDDQKTHMDALWVCPYVPFSECWCVIRHRRNGSSIKEGKGRDWETCDVEIFSENGTAVAVVLGFGIQSHALSMRMMEGRGNDGDSSVSTTVCVA
ncbi:AMP-binding enzyme domain-containing protein [Toxoplasma gondii VEG]|uniref:AMP-binding enzyme domain-containing protein n=1 Tax=Toxoplasma gondii (strain ATCC 50861 / VEG) TaxID=432359 RepID=V4ZF64_TOXGV|nr:AMP-binding enzyme domain-containing protein [Toxoplasma gondii VEG]